MTSYKNILSHVSKWEGGLVYIAREGQWTNRGIQFTTWLALGPGFGFVPTLAAFKAMTQSQWERFVEYYWNKATFNNSIKNQDAANLMFQAYWGSGNAGIKDMQRALKVYNSQLAVDGIVGNATVKTINENAGAASVLYRALKNRYVKLASGGSSYAQFLKGWLNRLKELKPGYVIGGGLVGLLLFFLVMYKNSNNG